MKVMRYATDAIRLIVCLVLTWLGAFTPFLLFQALNGFSRSSAMYALTWIVALAAGIKWWQRGGLAFSRA